jgi:2-dehydropantoate 2-reductase
MRLVVVGIGAIGGVVGGFLAHAGREVVLVARGAQHAAIAERGLQAESPAGRFTVRPHVVDSAARVDWRDSDVAVLAVKTQDAEAALIEIAAAAPDVAVVCLTNGVEAERLALRRLPAVYAACVMMPASFLVPGVVQTWVSPMPGVIDLGRYPAGRDAVAEAIAAELVAAGFASEVRDDAMAWKRAKLLMNVGNAIDALCGRAARFGALAQLADQARAEALACFAAGGLACTEAAVFHARVALAAARPIAGVKRTGGSTWQSLARGARTLETDYLNGEIALLGRLHGVATPVNVALQRVAAEAARRGEAPGSMAASELERRVAAVIGLIGL